MKLLTEIFKSISIIFVIFVLSFAIVFILSIFLPENVERAIEIFKNLFKAIKTPLS